MDSDESDLLALLHRAGLDPRDPDLEYEYALAVAFAQARHEEQTTVRIGYWSGVGYVSAHTGKWDRLEKLAFTKPSATASNAPKSGHRRRQPSSAKTEAQTSFTDLDITLISQAYNLTPAQVRAELANGRTFAI